MEFKAPEKVTRGGFDTAPDSKSSVLGGFEQQQQQAAQAARQAPQAAFTLTELMSDKFERRFAKASGPAPPEAAGAFAMQSGGRSEFSLPWQPPQGMPPPPQDQASQVLQHFQENLREQQRQSLPWERPQAGMPQPAFPPPDSRMRPPEPMRPPAEANRDSSSFGPGVWGSNDAAQRWPHHHQQQQEGTSQRPNDPDDRASSSRWPGRYDDAASRWDGDRQDTSSRWEGGRQDQSSASRWPREDDRQGERGDDQGGSSRWDGDHDDHRHNSSRWPQSNSDRQDYHSWGNNHDDANDSPRWGGRQDNAARWEHGDDKESGQRDEHAASGWRDSHTEKPKLPRPLGAGAPIVVPIGSSGGGGGAYLDFSSGRPEGVKRTPLPPTVPPPLSAVGDFLGGMPPVPAPSASTLSPRQPEGPPPSKALPRPPSGPPPSFVMQGKGGDEEQPVQKLLKPTPKHGGKSRPPWEAITQGNAEEEATPAAQEEEEEYWEDGNYWQNDEEEWEDEEEEPGTPNMQQALKKKAKAEREQHKSKRGQEWTEEEWNNWNSQSKKKNKKWGKDEEDWGEESPSGKQGQWVWKAESNDGWEEEGGEEDGDDWNKNKRSRKSKGKDKGKGKGKKKSKGKGKLGTTDWTEDDVPEMFGETWEQPRKETGLKLIGEMAPKGVKWEYVMKDENRRAFAAFLSCPFSKNQCNNWFEAVKDGTDWKQPTNASGGLVPRKTAWMTRQGCKCTYRYGGLEVETQIFPPFMKELLRHTMHYCGITNERDWPDSCNMNLYEDGGMSVGWHSDDETLFQGKFFDIRIISLSFGQTRKFQLRTNWPEYGEEPMREIELGSGDLMTMEGMTQKYFQHRVPKEQCEGPRINLTWRWVLKHNPKCPAGRRRR